jgi:CheY-like chemotaxis protein
MNAAPVNEPAPKRPVILVAEDEVLLRILISEVLQDQGYNVVEAANAAEALRVLAACPDVRVVVTDVEMPPGPSGIELAQHVRERWPYIQVLITSGRVIPAGLPEGVVFIAKPWTAVSLAECVNKAVGQVGPAPSR